MRALLDVNSSIQTIGGSDMDLLESGFDGLGENRSNSFHV